MSSAKSNVWSRTLAATGAFALGLLGSCSSDPSQGYSFTSTYRSDVESVSIPIFQNNTFSRGIEAELTEALAAEVRKSTPWKVTQGQSAQTTLSGSVTSSTMNKLTTERNTGLSEQMAVTITVDFEWKDNRTGKVLVSRRSFSSTETFIPSQGVGERVDVGQHGAIQDLARSIVAEMRSSW